MNPPGLIGLHRITEPLLSVPFASQQQVRPRISTCASPLNRKRLLTLPTCPSTTQEAQLLVHFGEKSPGDNPRSYLRSIQRAIAEHR